MNTKTVGRNDPCPCGSGKKYKQCCQNKNSSNSEAAKNRLLESIPNLFIKAQQAAKQNQGDIAENLYKEILTINPKHVLSLNNLGLLSQDLGKLDQAILYLQKAVKLEPTAQYHTNLARALMCKHQNEEATFHLKTALQFNPGDYLANNNLGLLLCNLNNFKEGLPYLYKAIQLNPNDYLSLYNVGVLLLKQGKHHEAGLYYRKAINTQSGQVSPYHNYLFCLCFEKGAFPHKYLSVAKELEQFYQARVTPYKQWNSSPKNSKTLKIGIVSGDLRHHAVSFFLEGVLSQLNKNTLKLVAYNTNPHEDALSQQLKPHFEAWYNVSQQTAQATAAQIHQHQIDVLIDLSGHTHHNGLNVFSYKPAPLQVSWLGYFASTGLGFMDYFIADPISVPTDKQSYFSEKIYYLPQTRLCFTPPHDELAPPVNALPALGNGYITFGCFQNLSKINDDMLQQWAQIIANCPNSKLLIKSHQLEDPFIKADFAERAQQAGISYSSLCFEGGSERHDYFKSYHRVDFMLDTFPYPGGTTTCEALWMGVPTLTLTGDTLLERQGHALLTAANLPNWVCANSAEYVQKAIAFAHDVEALSQTRATLRTQVQHSALMNAANFAQQLEKALFEMWQTP